LASTPAAPASPTAAPVHALDREYNPRPAIADTAAILQRWADESAAWRRRCAGLYDVAYGATPAERLDFFPAAAPDAPLFVFLHGGYWRALDKSDFTWIAPPLVAAGISVAIPNYALLPSADLETIVMQALAAHAWLYRNASRYEFDAAHIVTGGHSAGGHLAAMMLCAQWSRWGDDLPVRLVRAGLSVSGLHDLRPLTTAPFLKNDLRLDEAEAWRLSPASMTPAQGVRMIAAVGGLESRAFREQPGLLAGAWPAGTVDTLEVPGCHHFSVLEALAEPAHRLHAAVRTMCLARDDGQP
jgi:arylformamidase